MQTDWLLVRRLAAELDARLRGGRIATVGLLPDGRFAIDVRGLPGGGARLVVDAFAATPLVWIAGPDVAARDLRSAPGWSRAFAEGLEGRRIERVRGRTGDRLIALDARARSRFGVEHDVRLVLELTPKFGNLIMLKDQTIVAAAREFAPATASGGRTTVAGGSYDPPPLPVPRPEPDAERTAFAAYAAAAAHSREAATGTRPAIEPAVVRALRRDRPLLTPLTAGSLAAAAARTPWPSGEALRADLLRRGDALLAAEDAAAGGARGDAAPVHTYRVARSESETVATGGALAYAHVTALVQFEGDAELVHGDEPALAPLFAELAERAAAPVARDSFERRRARLVQRVERRRRAVAASLDAATREREDDGESERLRLAGDALFMHHAEIGPGATRFAVPNSEGSERSIDLDPALDARGNATAMFKRYRKLANRRVHAERRAGELGAEAARLDELAWELARAEPETLPELARSIDELLPTGSGVARGAPSERKRTGGKGASLRPHRIELGDGARLLVGRSPQGNAEVTFRLAKPDDWWFHARGVPGAHVVLQLDESREPTDDELLRAAETAASYSSAAGAPRVDVDRTRRKHVRKRDTGPGQVWYVNAQTIGVVPAARRDAGAR